MLAIPKIPETGAKYQALVEYLHLETIPEDYECKNNVVTSEIVDQHVSRVLQVQQSVNTSLDKYRAKLCNQGSVHKNKSPNNIIKAGTTIPTFSQQGVFKALASNNHIAIVEVNGKKIQVPVSRIKKKF
ncbi:16482_t:CDS:2 [Cetraspora pellucida]|uniref:16482_t:CDS:1 n=1 Tax=Cetraspora pellucida TaxID=1433469 RepID=A0A9N9D7F7_9GLOM|nr:16482_t:CDS:2 [Cetraspora pellucida]